MGYAPEHTVKALFWRLTQLEQAAVLDEIRLAEPMLGFAIMPGAAALLRALYGISVPLALVTGASSGRVARVSRVLPELGCFRAAVTWGEPLRGKPHPDPYLLAAERLGVPPQQCVVLEDAPSGIRAAVAAGAYCIGIGNAANADRLRASAADVVVSSLSDIQVRVNGPQLIVGETVIPLNCSDSEQEEAAAWR
jgi:HAD superfamily hydrolase (TIGR01509 family)